MKTLTLLSFAMLMAACSGCQPEREESGGEFRIEFRSCVIAPRPDDPTKYRALVVVRIHNASVGQDVSSQGVLRWREHIALYGGNTWNDDHHGTYQGEQREIRSWPAKVEGAAPNIHGTSLLWVEPGLVLGPPMDTLPVQGVLTGQDTGRMVVWTLDARADGVMVTIDGKEYWTAK